MGLHAPAPPSGRTADVAGLASVLALGTWAAVAAGSGSGHPGPFLLLLAGGVLVGAAARWSADRTGVATLGVLAVAISGAVALTLPGILRSGGPPTGYANSNATLAGLGVIAAIAPATASRRGPARTGWWILAAALAAAVLSTRSLAGAACLLVALVLLALTATTRRATAAILGGATAVVLVAAVTVAIAGGDDPLGWASEADVRPRLWSAALEITRDEPLRGVGVGRFDDLSRVSADPDLRWAHHGYLQLASETGVTGLVLGLALLAWGYCRLALASLTMPHRAALGAAAVTVVALHASVDHVLHHPAVVLSLAMVVGATTAHRPSLGRESPG